MSNTGNFKLKEEELINDQGTIDSVINKIKGNISEMGKIMSEVTGDQWMGKQRDEIIQAFETSNASHFKFAESLHSSSDHIGMVLDVYRKIETDRLNALGEAGTAGENGLKDQDYFYSSTDGYNLESAIKSAGIPLDQLSKDSKLAGQQLTEALIALTQSNTPEGKTAALVLSAAIGKGYDNGRPDLGGSRYVFGRVMSVTGNGTLVGDKSDGTKDIINLNEAISSSEYSDLVSRAQEVTTDVFLRRTNYNLGTYKGGSKSQLIRLDGTVESAAGKTYNIVKLEHITVQGSNRNGNLAYETDSAGNIRIIGFMYSGIV